jgi:hypothetical protein
LKLYTSSWIGLYFGYQGTLLDNNNNIVVFAKPETQIPINNTRFTVNVSFNSTLSQLYFLPSEIWKSIPASLNPKALIYQVDWLSNISHGMLTNGFAYTKSPYYKSPFFITFRTNHGIDANLLTFNTFLIPNSYDRILGLLTYNDDTDRFDIQFNSDILLPYTNVISLNNVLEFEIHDSDRKKVEFMDLSQLFIALEIL